MFRIETPRLVIRTWSPEDRPVYAAITSDPVVMRHLSGGRAHTEEEIDQFFERQERQLREHGVCMGALVERTSGAVIGIAGIQPLGTTPDLEIGWILGREFWGRGYATEAGKAAMRYVLETLERPRVVAIIDPDNLPSKAVAARLGMEYEGRFSGEQLGHRNPAIVVDLFVRLA